MSLLNIERFLTESNGIEGIFRPPLSSEINATATFLTSPLTLDNLLTVQAVYAPDMSLRESPGMNVRIGTYYPPPGGPKIRQALIYLLGMINDKSLSPWEAHIRFEGLHPFLDGNGRSGRVLWAYHMQLVGKDPFALDFLHRFYYQTLENMDREDRN